MGRVDFRRVGSALFAGEGGSEMDLYEFQEIERQQAELERYIERRREMYPEAPCDEPVQEECGDS